MKNLIAIIALAGYVTSPATVQSVPSTINYQGRLTDNSPQQAPLTATVDMSFELWDCASCNSPAPDRLWIEPASGTVPVPVTGGIFSVLLGGNGVPLPASLFSGGSQRWLQLVVNGEALAPRQLIGATGYAQQAENAANATTTVNSAQLGGVAANGWQRALSVTACPAGQLYTSIAPNGTASCAAPQWAAPISVTGDFPSPSALIGASNTGNGYGVISGSESGVAIIASTRTGVALEAVVIGAGYSAGTFETWGLGNPYPTLQATASGTGPAGNFRIANAGSAAPALTAVTNGTGPAAAFTGNVTMTGKASSAATLAGDPAGTLATKGYVDAAAGVPVPLSLSGGSASPILAASNSGAGNAIRAASTGGIDLNAAGSGVIRSVADSDWLISPLLMTAVQADVEPLFGTPMVTASSPAGGFASFMLPVSWPAKQFGSATLAKSFTVCYRVQGTSYIMFTALRQTDNFMNTIDMGGENVIRNSTSPQCYTLPVTQSAAVAGPAVLVMDAIMGAGAANQIVFGKFTVTLNEN